MVKENPAVPRNQTQSVWLEAPVSYNHWTTTSLLHNWYTNASVTEPGSTLKILHNIKLFPSEATCSKHTFTKISTSLNLCFPLQSRKAQTCVYSLSLGKLLPNRMKGSIFSKSLAPSSSLPGVSWAVKSRTLERTTSLR